LKKVLVTGADGFIGSHLVESLLETGEDVRAFVFYNSLNSRGWLDTIPPDKLKAIEIVQGDIRDEYRVRTATKDVDVVFHLAALIAIPFSYLSPRSYVDTNVGGTLNVLQAARDYGIGKVLITSTSEVYGTAKYVPIDEKHPRQGQSPYAASKIGADALAESFWKSFRVPVVVGRPFNTFGPRQSARAIIPAVIIQLLEGRDTICLGGLHPTRDFVFVRDTVDGLQRIAASDGLVGEAVNIATGTEISIGDLASKIIAMINPRARIETEAERLRPAESEVERLCGSSALLQSSTGWSPKVSLAEGLAWTIDWFRNPENRARYKSEIYNL